MEMSGSQRIEASRETVWKALNDAEILRRCIPGCQEITQDSPVDLKARITLKIGPIKAAFAGAITLSELDPPNGYYIAGEGTGGVAGFAKGGARVWLDEDGDATILNYDAKANVGGKIAQLGARLIDSTARKLAHEFFEQLGRTIAPPVETAAE